MTPGRIKKIRESLGHTQEEMGKLIGLKGPRMYQNYENGNAEIPMARAVLLESLYNNYMETLKTRS